MKKYIGIAVFAPTMSSFRDAIHVTPPKVFIRINNVEDITGRKFIGIIKIYGWWNDKRIEEAYRVLKIRQPELFPTP